MGKFDKEVLYEINNFMPSNYTNCQEIYRDLLDKYETMKKLLIVDISVPGLLRKLNIIKLSTDFIVQKQLLEQLIEELQPQLYERDEIIGLVSNIASDCISLISIFRKIPVSEILQNVANIYVQKNGFYGDVWYGRKETGICIDMGRKVVRLEGIFDKNLSPNKEETLYDTLSDLINYCSLMTVYIKYIS